MKASSRQQSEEEEAFKIFRVGIEFSGKLSKFEWPRQTNVALSHLLKSLSQGLLFNSGGELNYTSEDQSKCKMANAIKESGQISNTSKIHTNTMEPFLNCSI